MSEMVERVVKAFLSRRLGIWKDVDFEIARASIIAMREPTDAMVRAGVEYRLNITIGGENKWPDDTAALWRAMIDAALAPVTPSPVS